MKECLVVNQKVGASNPRARPLLSPSANLTYRHQAASTVPSFCSPRSPSTTVLRNRCSALNCVRHHSFTPVRLNLWVSLRVADHPGAISRGVADRDAKCDHFCG